MVWPNESLHKVFPRKIKKNSIIWLTCMRCSLICAGFLLPNIVPTAEGHLDYLEKKRNTLLSKIN